MSLHNARADAFVVHFECGFTKTKQKLRLKTGPFDPTTHWQQTIFYLQVYRL